MCKTLPSYSRNRKKTSMAGMEGMEGRGVGDAVRGAVGGNRGTVETHRPAPEGLDRMVPHHPQKHHQGLLTTQNSFPFPFPDINNPQ